MSEKIKITFEAEREIVISKRNLFEQSRCAACNAQVGVVKLETRMLFPEQVKIFGDLLTAGVFHAVEAEREGLILICLNSLLEAIGKRDSKSLAKAGINF
jgi:hypothetical protein